METKRGETIMEEYQVQKFTFDENSMVIQLANELNELSAAGWTPKFVAPYEKDFSTVPKGRLPLGGGRDKVYIIVISQRSGTNYVMD
ncbi:MAG TPA: hypothetical protein DHN29_21610 [Cytophagales bacterium]|nr:hypothetical protein [Cytophagales bacterium]|tara:strand:+ start:3295 stop:3555 length:261 start_codon:yes stop_codon:yes gene_type:complete